LQMANLKKQNITAIILDPK